MGFEILAPVQNAPESEDKGRSRKYEAIVIKAKENPGMWVPVKFETVAECKAFYHCVRKQGSKGRGDYLRNMTARIRVSESTIYVRFTPEQCGSELPPRLQHELGEPAL